jgi:hypothetical protein
LRNWFIVHPKGKELSLVTTTCLDFSIGYALKNSQAHGGNVACVKGIIEEVGAVKEWAVNLN